MTIHLFGATSSPSCASFCLRQTAKEFGKYYDPQISEIVFENFCVDNYLISFESEQRAVEVVHDLRALLLKGGFNLRKWLSTNKWYDRRFNKMLFPVEFIFGSKTSHSYFAV